MIISEWHVSKEAVEHVEGLRPLPLWSHVATTVDCDESEVFLTLFNISSDLAFNEVRSPFFTFDYGPVECVNPLLSSKRWQAVVSVT